MYRITFALIGVLAIVSCAPRVVTKISRQQPAYTGEVRIYPVHEDAPDGAIELGDIRITDSGFSTDCGYERVIDLAIAETRKAGGNAFKIRKHSGPDLWSTCDRIEGVILMIDEPETGAAVSVDGTDAVMQDYAMLHLFWPAGFSGMLNYVVHVNDSSIIRMRPGVKCSLRIEQEGYHEVWAKTEGRSTVGLEVEFGKHYYVKCGRGGGFFIGRPQLAKVSGAAVSEYHGLKYISSKRDSALSFPRFGLAVGASHNTRSAKINPESSEPEKKMYDQLKTGRAVDACGVFYLSEYFGLGLQYNTYSTDGDVENVVIAFSDGTRTGGTMTGMTDIDQLSGVFRTQLVSGKGLFRYSVDVGLGRVWYQEELEVGSYHVLATGTGLGIIYVLGLGIALDENISLEAGVAYRSGAIKDITVKTGDQTEKRSLDPDEYISTGRMGFGAGLDWHF